MASEEDFTTASFDFDHRQDETGEILEEIAKCQKSAQELKQSLLDQQELLRQSLFQVFKLKLVASHHDPKTSDHHLCPMCESVLITDYQDFEQHVLDHFDLDEGFWIK